MAKKITTVRRNTKRFAAIFAQATAAKSFTLDNGFCGREVDLNYVRDEMPGEAKARAKVYDKGDGRFTVHYHSNHWVEITSPA